MTETITREQYIKAYKDAPEVVRAVYDADSTTQVIVDMKNKFQLHIDKAGVLGTEVGYLLLGLTSPDKFTARLREQGFSDKMVTDIVKEVNEKIFVPLREEMKKRTQTAAPASSASPRTTQGTARPTAPLPVRPTAQMAGNEPFAPRSGAPAQRSDLRSVLASVTKETKLLEDHEEPHIEFKKVPAPPPANLPGAIYHPPIVPPKPPVPIQPPPPPSTPPPVPLKPKPAVPVAPYSSDPYREPI